MKIVNALGGPAKFGPLGALVACAGLIGWLYADVLAGMASEWYQNPNYSHGFLVPVVSGYFVWLRREEIARTGMKPFGWGLSLLVLGLLMFLLGGAGAAHTTLRISMLVVIGGVVLFLLGPAMFAVLFFAYAYLLFMIPLPAYLYDAIAFPLKGIVARLSVWFLQAIDVSVYREGNLIVFPSTTLEVAEACSGIRSIMSLLAVAVAFGELRCWEIWKRIALAAIVVPIAIFANGARVVIMGLVARTYGERFIEGALHDTAGLGVFLMMLALLIGVGWLLGKWRSK